MNYKVKDIVRICQGKLIHGSEEKECNTFCIDTRTINSGDVYIGIKGESLNGNNYYKNAIEKGASTCILDNDTDINISECRDVSIILVNDTIIALQTLAKDKRSKYDIPVIAVTGSVGKTSTKDIIANVLAGKYNVLKTEGNFNNHIGLPLTILRLQDHNCLVVEMGMNHFKEISVLTNIAKPTIGVITNIGTAHIGYLGSRENILKAKLELLEGLDKDGILIVNNDNDMLHNISVDQKLITVGIDNPSNYMAMNINEEPFSSTFTINNVKCEIPIGGRAFIYNSLFAYAVGDILKVDNISQSFKNVKLSSSRLEKKITHDGVIVIDDSYNANLDSMENALSLLGKTKNRKIAFLGDILELDDYSMDIHKKVGKIVSDNNIDILITVGKLSKYIVEGALENNFSKDNIYSFNDIDETYELLDKILKKDDIILFKASHSMNFKQVVDYLCKKI